MYSFYLQLTMPEMQNKSLTFLFVYLVFLLDIKADLYDYSSAQEKCRSLRT